VLCDGDVVIFFVVDAEGEEEADKDAKNSESDAITAAVHTPLPTETTPEGIYCWLFFSCAIGLDLLQ